MTTNLLASGADDGSVKVWDLRYPSNDCICELQWHKKSITSIQFQPNSDSTLAVSSADNNLSIWDYAVENDDLEIQNEEDVPD
jgi:ribosome assembly protein RRB1